MSRVKYVIVERGGLEHAYVFGELDSHRGVAFALLEPMNWDSPNPYERARAAGFCHMEAAASGNLRWRCYGESTTLKIASRGELDERILNSQLGGTDD
jgi:hypothetical protein